MILIKLLGLEAEEFDMLIDLWHLKANDLIADQMICRFVNYEL